MSNPGFGFGCHPFFAAPCCEEVIVVVEVVEVRVVIELLIEVVEEGVEGVVEKEEVVAVLGEGISWMDLNKGQK